MKKTMMKRILIACYGITLLFLFAAAAHAHTLTVKSAYPSSGVAITVSPNDNLGKGNGTTEFTRRYRGNTVVTLTAPACPVADSLPREVEAKIEAIDEVTEATVDIVWDPPWHPSMMTDYGRERVGYRE